MKAEHWDNNCIFGVDENGNHPNKDFLTKDSELCCIIEGPDWNDIMTKYHIHVGFEPYKSTE